MSNGYFAIGIFHSKRIENLGTLWRSADNLGAAYIFTIGRRYTGQGSDTTKAYKRIPLINYPDWETFLKARPMSTLLIGIEQCEKSQSIINFTHPPRAIYLLGAEDYGLSKEIIKECQKVISIPTINCINVAVAGSIVMFDRIRQFKEDNLPTRRIQI
ncbi:MAG TPA: RNA methyltransferase [Nitrosopumilaceae archaeon]|jgi:tRNA G18 (ribose-2'-O)-methylase SpoU|nr:RNA methyltransferase [Nitrosopumilaceae archaeon]